MLLDLGLPVPVRLMEILENTPVQHVVSAEQDQAPEASGSWQAGEMGAATTKEALNKPTDP